jgi:hypothetical protein
MRELPNDECAPPSMPLQQPFTFEKSDRLSDRCLCDPEFLCNLIQRWNLRIQGPLAILDQPPKDSDELNVYRHHIAAEIEQTVR